MTQKKRIPSSSQLGSLRAGAVWIEDQFSKHAHPLRDYFDLQMKDPTQAHSKRFVWDYWNIPDQYTVLRTPAYHYFPKPLYTAFHEELVLWGRRHLGCHDISPPWLSNYVEGCQQNFHSDLPHGPFAFVFSLTPPVRRFSGGETFLLQPKILDFWNSLSSQTTFENEHILKKITPEFNRWILFDPRVPHGVTEVRGTTDPRQGRLVIHGWFVQPRPYVEGPLSEKLLQKKINQLDPLIDDWLAHVPAQIDGILTFRFRVERDGKIKSIQNLVNTLTLPSSSLSLEQKTKLNQEIKSICQNNIASWEFSGARSIKMNTHSDVTLPLVFSASPKDG